MADQHLHMQIDLGAIPESVQHLLQAATNMVAIGLNVEHQVSNEYLDIPGIPIQHRFGAAPWSSDRTKASWETWVLRNGFRDVAEAIGVILEWVQSVLSYWDLSKLQRLSGGLTGSDWNEIVVGRYRRFHRRTLPQRIEFLKKSYSFEFPTAHLDRLMSLNAARNCLVHRGGIVSHEDLVDGQEALFLRWSALVTLLEQNGIAQEVVPPIVIEPGGKVWAESRERTKMFSVGDQLSVNATEFGEICWSLFEFSVVCAELMREHGCQHFGIVFDTGTP